MKIFNRIVVILILAGIFVLGVSAVFYGFGIAGYRLENLPSILGLSNFYGEVSGYVRNIENRNLLLLDFVVLGIIALIGLVLLIFELKPPSPRRVRMRQGTYVTRRAVEDEAVEAVEQSPEVLQSNVSVKARRRPGAKIEVEANVRLDEDIQGVQSAMQSRIRRHLTQVGIPVDNLKVQVTGSDPRETRTRVK